MMNLRCRPGDLARVTRAWNPALVGRVVLVGELHSLGESEWNVTLLGEPAMTFTKNRKRLTIGNRALAFDHALEPLRGDEPPAEANKREACHDHA
ncbi:hypothetical protein WL78_00455 [Burkholderia ubonensis]|uniref:hypothetical protein n=1 Tax=Burkholderia ubonensis TaxID=101571 RepID=UPI000753FB8E|nr:hypothetical protein [Burkholderia ubonensis]KWE77267.1 hypothetical protein WL78_00455 [Burkholderia ubonensis]